MAGNPRLRGESGALGIPSSGTVEFVHGLGRVPVTQVTLQCLVAENGYSRGDEVPAVLGYARNAAAPSQPFVTATITDAKVIVTRNSGNAEIWKKDASAFGTITTANWAIRIRCL